MLQILYGIAGNYADITEIALNKCVNQNQLVIPSNDCVRAAIFGDPIFGTLKHIRVNLDNQTTIYDHTQLCIVDLSSFEMGTTLNDDLTLITDPAEKLARIHRQLKFSGGNIRDEYIEQIMAVSYLKPDAVVLELGSNIGRNSLIIATLLNNQRNFVTLECDPESYRILLNNRDQNNYTFHAENAALSYQKLIQKGWDTIPSETVLPGYFSVNTITYEELQIKYGLYFDTLVVDCEGALYYILKDRPSILDNITTIIMENDYRDITHKNFIDDLMRSKGLSRVYVKSGGWGPCYGNFYEVWQR